MGISTIIEAKVMNSSKLILFLFQKIKEVMVHISSLTFWDGVLFCILIGILCFLFNRRREYEMTSVEINLPFGLGNITYLASNQDRIVAWKIYVQLKSRKAALMFNDQQDVIADVYESLYSIFPIARDLLMSLPLGTIERNSSVSDLVFRALNDGIRSHLTKWQSCFLRWWEFAKADPVNKNRSPQEIQKDYPKYNELIAELKTTNVELNKFADDLLLIVQSRKKRGSKKYISFVPVRPSPD